MSEAVEALVIGAGPAGLMAADILSAAGRHVVVAEAMPTPARKFLMAGKSGLNLTRNEDFQTYASRFRLGTGQPVLGAAFLSATDRFGPAEVMGWAEGLGIPLFTGSTGRVFPVGMKASPLLRAWLGRLREQGVDLRTRWQWRGGRFLFDTPEGQRLIQPKVAVLALGGASWPGLGSDAAWVSGLREAGVRIADFHPANMGFRVDWSASMARFFGGAIKGSALFAGNLQSRGEWVITSAGIEGGGIYEVAAAIRDGATAHADLMPDIDADRLAQRLDRPRGKLSIGNWLRRGLGDPVAVALLLEWGRPWPVDAAGWARRAKNLPVAHQGPMPLARAISSAGGICWSALDAGQELRAMPGVFAAGEMLDWEAPTGGYLLSGCLASGRVAGLAALARMS